MVDVDEYKSEPLSNLLLAWKLAAENIKVIRRGIMIVRLKSSS